MGQSILKTLVTSISVIVIAIGLIVILIIIPAYVHRGICHIPGAYDGLYLSKYSPYDTIIMEIDYQTGMEPDPEAINELQQHIEQYSGKNVVLYLSEDISDNEVPKTITGNDIFTVATMLQQSHRDYPTGWLGGNITLYIMYLDTVWHPAHSDNNYCLQHYYEYAAKTKIHSVGVTYAADSFIIFKDSLIRDDMETTILLHEMGHIWGLEHSQQKDNVMNARFDVFDSIPNNHNPIQSEFPQEFSIEDQERLKKVHDSAHIIPLFIC